MKVNALKTKVLVTELERGNRVVKGFVLLNDNGKSEGIRPRWARVYSVGEEIKDIVPGQWILIENGRWTRMLTVKEDDGTEVNLWGVEYPKSVLLVADECPDTEIFSQWA